MTDLASQPKPNWFSRLAHPGSFMAWSRPLVVPLAVATALLFVAGLYVGFFRAPLETENVGSTLPLLFDPQTAGGLLAAVPADHVADVPDAMVIGEVRARGIADTFIELHSS